MEVHFVDEYQDTLYISNNTNIPRVSDFVSFKEDTYRVKRVLWDIVKDVITVELTSSPEKAIKESAPEVNNVHEVRLALQKAERALKETKTLRNELFTV